MAGDITTATRRLVAERSGGRCEAMVAMNCWGGSQHLHHRLRRGHGIHIADNLLAVCRACHDWIHANPSESYKARLLLHEWDELTPLRTTRGP